MSKAILVMDMPEECYVCPFYYETRDEDDDYVSKCEVLNDMTIDGFAKKYDGCPLKELPNKKRERCGMCRRDYRGNWETYGEKIDSVAVGYNQCLDEILNS